MEETADSDLTHEALIHDLNNVFETIIESAELLKTDKHWKTLAETLCRCVARGQRLIGAIPDRTPNLASVVNDAIQSVTDYCIAARKPRIRFVQDVEATIRLPGSAKDWERVFANLFLNTVQIVCEPARIDIAAEKTEGLLTIKVWDDGPGIPTEILGSLFRARVSTKSAANRRCGLGLHIVATIVKKYSGRVLAGNRDGSSGAIFTISLPVN
jgi:signal transduction histidine kinase